MSCSIISGDSRNLVFGPFNSCYKDLRHHLKLANLQELTLTGNPSQHCWKTLCDVNACLEALTTNSSPSGYAIDASGNCLPTPQNSTATLKVVDDFQLINIPYEPELISSYTIPIPQEFVDAFHSKEESLISIKEEIKKVTGDYNKAASTILSKKFMVRYLIAFYLCLSIIAYLCAYFFRNGCQAVATLRKF